MTHINMHDVGWSLSGMIICAGYVIGCRSGVLLGLEIIRHVTISFDTDVAQEIGLPLDFAPLTTHDHYLKT